MGLSLGDVTAWAEGTVIEGDIAVKKEGLVTGLLVSNKADASGTVTGREIITGDAGTVTVTGGIFASATESSGTVSATGVILAF